MEKFGSQETQRVIDEEIKHNWNLKLNSKNPYRSNEYTVAVIALQELRKKLFGEYLEIP